MTLVAPKRIPRDCLTGQPLRAGLPTFVIHVPVHRQRARYLEPSGDVVSAPISLHRRETEGVGLTYAVLMAQYLHLSVAEQQSAQARAEHLAMIAWWRNEYGIRRVLAGLSERLPMDAAKHVLEVVLTCHQEEADPAAIAERFGHSERWVLDRVRLCMRLAHWHRRRCTCESCEQRREHSRA